MLAVGAIGLGSFNWVIHQTSTNEFCFVCHSHVEFIQPEYEASSHFSNASGVRASCGDCHLPHGWFELVTKKIIVSADVVPELMGKISTREKYEAHRAELAVTVWERYKENDSEFCRHCHSLSAMVLEEQNRFASRRHARAEERGETCIDCHQGIVHQLPEDWESHWQALTAELGEAAEEAE